MKNKEYILNNLISILTTFLNLILGMTLNQFLDYYLKMKFDIFILNKILGKIDMDRQNYLLGHEII